MEPFVTLTAKTAPLKLADVDTDLIIPAQHLTGVSKKGYGAHLFERLRKQDPHFFLNQKKYCDAQILITRGNFGCGSSREHAVWAILDAGYKVIIAPSFADIFFSNGAKNGLLLVQLPEEVVELLLEEAESGTYELTVDLQRQKVLLPDDTDHDFDFDPFRKDCILNGYDDLRYIFSNKDKIAEYKKAAESRMFYSTLVRNRG